MAHRFSAVSTYLAPAIKACGTAGPVDVALVAAGLWWSWPWLDRVWFPASGSADSRDMLVVFDGTPIRWAQADRIAAALRKSHRVVY